MSLDAEIAAVMDTVDGRHGRERPRRDHRTTLRRIWDAEHLTVLSTKVSKADAKRFRAACWEHGRTPYSVLQAFVEAYSAR